MSQLQRVAITPDQIQQQAIHLTLEQQHYLYRVLRLQAGDRFIAMDGVGHWWLSELQAGVPEAQILQSLEAQTELPISVTLLAALPKGSGFDDVVRQVTELGVSCIVPVLSARTLLKPSSSRIERWRRIAQEAAEQSERLIIPEILDPLPFTQALEMEATHRYLCAARQHTLPLWQHLQQVAHAPMTPSILVAVGPEGGWTDAEIESAIAAHYYPVRLGRRILRAVTAPLVALSCIVAAFEREAEG